MTFRRVAVSALLAVCAVLIAAVPDASAHHRQICGLYDSYPPPVAHPAGACDPAAFYEAPRSELRWAGGIWVHRSIADDVTALLAAAAADGHTGIRGEGFRTYKDQLRLRGAHCGDSEHGLYLMPAVQCSPPTARPGRSMHQRGLAVDFTVNGELLNAEHAFHGWLTDNAAEFGLHNYPLETWHWSTNGK